MFQFWSNTYVCAVSFYHAETPIALIKQQLTTITRNTFRHCRVRLYAFVGQPFTEQLYLNQRKPYSAMLWLVFLLHGHSDTKLVRVAQPYVDELHLQVLKSQQKFTWNQSKILCIALCNHSLSLQRRVKGIITRKDLMGFQIEERIHSVLHDSPKEQEMQSPTAHHQSVEAWTKWDSFPGIYRHWSLLGNFTITTKLR